MQPQAQQSSSCTHRGWALQHANQLSRHVKGVRNIFLSYLENIQKGMLYLTLQLGLRRQKMKQTHTHTFTLPHALSPAHFSNNKMSLIITFIAETPEYSQVQEGLGTNGAQM